ncbi:hypothetical protein [Synechococcus sp. MW101C3]|uniref:hypothetical protein n=1 Tax=Synechococcus sp. MW101C3 TaxID=210768 RepID=UPI001E3F992E|nr:hypothetical protein [Synechococcus sp. MW101C3]
MEHAASGHSDESWLLFMNQGMVLCLAFIFASVACSPDCGLLHICLLFASYLQHPLGVDLLASRFFTGFVA